MITMIMDGLFCYGCCKQNDIHSPYVIIYESLFCYGLVYRLKSISKPERLAYKVLLDTFSNCLLYLYCLIELNLLREALVGLPGVRLVVRRKCNVFFVECVCLIFLLCMAVILHFSFG